MSRNKKIQIVIFGIGNVGSTLIQQIKSAQSKLQSEHQLQVEIPVITNSKLAFYNDSGLKNSWSIDFDKFSVPYSVKDIIQYVKTQGFQNVIAIDATASIDFVKNYVPLIESGFHIVSANKLANTLSYEFYTELRYALKKHQKTFLYETNVGAGLPIIETIKSLYNSGEQIAKIRGVFSGSLSYIFNEYSESDLPFSKVLSRASKLGLTEPDAREDLSGNDVARKLLILARELNLKTEFKQVKIESLVPKTLNGKTSLSQFNARTKELDGSFQNRKKDLAANEVLRYVGELDVAKQTLEVKLVAANKESPLGQLKGADSLFEIFTESYGESPVVIQGAGAGKAVTARGLFSDIIKVSNSLN
ncbi:aspartate kinase [Bizionia sp. KMM 8389]